MDFDVVFWSRSMRKAHSFKITVPLLGDYNGINQGKQMTATIEPTNNGKWLACIGYEGQEPVFTSPPFETYEEAYNAALELNEGVYLEVRNNGAFSV